MSIFSRLFGKKKKSPEEEQLKPEYVIEKAKKEDVARKEEPVRQAEKGADEKSQTMTAPAPDKETPAQQETVKKVENKKETAPAVKAPVEKAKPDAESAKNRKVPAKPKTEKAVKEDPAFSAEVAGADPTDIDGDTVPEADVKQPITGRFEIKRSKDGRFVFNLFASNRVGIATSQVYSSAKSALIGIKSVIANAATAPIEDQTVKDYTTLPYPKWEIYKDKGNEFRFRLSASNGSCVCHSQGYTSKVNCRKGIESIIKSSRNAEIDKAYLKKNET